MSVLFSRLPDADRALAAGLLRAMSPAVVTLSLLQTTNSALVGAGRARVPVLTMGIGVLVKTALTLALLPLPAFGHLRCGNRRKCLLFGCGNFQFDV